MADAFDLIATGPGICDERDGQRKYRCERGTLDGSGDQQAAARLRPTATEAVWLHVTRGDTVTRDAPITAAAINNVVQRRVLAAGLENASGYSAYSLRAGFVTEAKNRGIDEADIMRHTRHKSVQIMRRYDRTSGLWIRNATTGVSL